jgi:hypothetical protein
MLPEGDDPINTLSTKAPGGVAFGTCLGYFISSASVGPMASAQI